MAAKIAKNNNFWYKFAPKKKSNDSIVKLEYRCTTRKLPLCNGTIIVLKITLLRGVSVITIFVIRKRDIKKQTRNQYASPPRGNAIPAGLLSDSDEILCR